MAGLLFGGLPPRRHGDSENQPRVEADRRRFNLMREEEEGKGGGPARPEYIRLIKIAIVAVIVVVALVIAIPFVQDALRQPRMTLTDTSIFRQPCGLFGTSQTYSFLFTLVNSGDADGIANVQFLLDGINSANVDYFVPAGSSVEKSANLQVGGCGAHTSSIVLGFPESLGRVYLS